MHKEGEVHMDRNRENYFALKQNAYSPFQSKSDLWVTVVPQDRCCSLRALTGHFLEATDLWWIVNNLCLWTDLHILLDESIQCTEPLKNIHWQVLLSKDDRTTFSKSEDARLILYKYRNYSVSNQSLIYWDLSLQELQVLICNCWTKDRASYWWRHRGTSLFQM